jgi:capsular polysaccharide biosynthesis protein
MLLAVGFVILATPKYTAVAALLTETNRATPAPSDARQEGTIDTAIIDSQIAILNSEGIARAAIGKLKLADDPEFNKPGLLGRLQGLIGLAGSRDENEVADAVMTRFKRGLTVSQVGHGYIAEISVTSLDAKKSADIANAIADAYIQDQLGAKLLAAQRAGKWMEDWTEKSRREANDASRAVDEFRAANSGATSEPNSRAENLQGLEKTAESKRSAYETVRTRSGRLRQFVEDQAFPFTQARIITEAQPPASPSYPKTAFILLGAIAASGLAGVSVAYARELLDGRLRSADQFHELFGIRRVVTVPWPQRRAPAADVDRSVLAFWRSGTADAAIWRIKAAVDRHVSGGHPRLVMFVSPRHCDGRATLLRAFAEVLVKAGERTLLIDGDSIRAALTKALTPNRQVSKGPRGESGAGFRPLAVDGFGFLPAARSSGVDDFLTRIKSRDAMAHLGELYDYVLIDLPPMLESGQTAAMMTVGSSSCVLVVHSDCSSSDDVARGLELSLLDADQITTAALITSSPER